MDAATWLNVLAITISVCALVASVWLGGHQVRAARQANCLPAFIELLSEFRSPELHDQYTYVCSRLNQEHSPDGGLRALPGETRENVYNVAYFFQTFASLYALGIIDEGTAITMVRRRTTKVWQALQPYVERERQYPDVDPNMLSLLEAFAKISAEYRGPSPTEVMGARHKRASLLRRLAPPYP
ncbi:hypothetical protein [Streptomyces sp. NPDC014793]|uniref:DUF4760 domain-containing protein n=1 Tax=Streptomyces sp. NPDC014793 TaxID=3364914 RepID=UPI0036F86339